MLKVTPVHIRPRWYNCREGATCIIIPSPSTKHCISSSYPWIFWLNKLYIHFYRPYSLPRPLLSLSLYIYIYIYLCVWHTGKRYNTLILSSHLRTVFVCSFKVNSPTVHSFVIFHQISIFLICPYFQRNKTFPDTLLINWKAILFYRRQITVSTRA